MDENEDKRIIQPGQRARPQPLDGQQPQQPALPAIPKQSPRGLGRAVKPIQWEAPVNKPAAVQPVTAVDLRQIAEAQERTLSAFNSARNRAILEEIDFRASDTTQKDGATFTEDVFLPGKLSAVRKMVEAGADPDDVMAFATRELPEPYRPREFAVKGRVWEMTTPEGILSRTQTVALDYLKRLYGMDHKTATEKVSTLEGATQVINDTENQLEKYASDNAFGLGSQAAIEAFMGPAITKAWEWVGDLTTAQGQQKARDVRKAWIEAAMQYRNRRLSDGGFMGTLEQILTDVLPSLPRQISAQVVGNLAAPVVGGGAAMGLVGAADAKVMGLPQHEIRRSAVKGTLLGVFGSLGEMGVIAASSKITKAMPSLAARFTGVGAVSVGSEYGLAKALGEEYTLKDAISSFLLEGAFAAAETSPQAQRASAWRAYSSGEKEKILGNGAAAAAKMIEFAVGRPMTEREFFSLYDSVGRLKSPLNRAKAMQAVADKMAAEGQARASEERARLLDEQRQRRAANERRAVMQRGFETLDEEAVANIGMQEGEPVGLGRAVRPMSDEELSARMAGGAERLEAEGAQAERLRRQMLEAAGFDPDAPVSPTEPPAPAAPAAEVAAAEGRVKYDLMKDGIEGEAVDYRRVQNGSEYFEYAIGRVEKGAPLEVFRRSISNRGSYGGWRWETDVSKLKPAAPAKAAPSGVPGPGQRLLDGINEALARGETVYVRTATRATVISPETAAKWRDQGIPLFKLTAQGDLLMARGKKYEQIRSRAGWGSAVSTQTLDDVTKPESAYATPATQSATSAPARGVGGARRGKKAASAAGPVEGRPAPVARVSGARSQVPVQGGTAQDVEYAVMEMADIKPSNDPTNMFAATPGYPTENKLQERDYANDPNEQGKVRANAASLRPDEIINTAPSATTGPSIVTPDGTVINGNSRAMSLKLASAAGNMGEYRRVLAERARQFGIDPESIKGMREPVLVRVVDMDPRSEAAAVFGRQGNITTTQAVSPTKRAGRYVRLIDDEILDAINAAPDSTISEILNNPQASRSFREALARSLPPSEVPEFFNADRSFTVAGQELAQNILLMKAIPQEVVERMSPELRRTVSQSVPQLVQMVRTEGLREASDAFEKALDVLIGPMRGGAVSPEVLMGQEQMFGDKPQLSGIERMMLDFVYRERGASRRMRDRLAALITSQEQAGLMPEPLNEMMARSLEVEERPMGDERMSVGRGDGATPSGGMEGAMPPGDPGLQSARAWAEQNLVPHLRAKPRPLRERFGPNPTPEQRAQHRREMLAWRRRAADLRGQLVDKIINNQAEAETVDTVRTGTKVDRLAQDLKSGKITQEEFNRRVSEQMDAEMARREVDRARKATGARIRGRDRVMEVLYAASRKGEISPEMVAIADWLLSQNPELADTLALRVIERRGKYEKSGVEGVYNTGERLVTLFKGIGESLTVAHEILHHLERFMPAPMRAAVRAEYLAQLDKAVKAASADLAKARKANDEKAITKASNLILFLNKISEYHRGGKASLLEEAVGMITDGSVEQAMYRLTQPSEFWAENGSRILKSRFEAKDRGIWARIRQWLREFAQKVKSVFGGRSDAPIIRAMDYILKQSGAVETTSYGLGGRARTGDIYASGARAQQQGRGEERFSLAAGGIPPAAGGGDSPVEGGETPEGPGPGQGLGATRAAAPSGPPAGGTRRYLQDSLGESGGVLRGKGDGLGDMIYEKIKMGVARGREIRAKFVNIGNKVTRKIAGKRVERATQRAFEHDGAFYFQWKALMKNWMEPKNKAETDLRDVAMETSAKMWNEAATRLGTRLGPNGEEIMKTMGRGRTLPHDFHDYMLDVMMDPRHPDREAIAKYIVDATNRAIASGEIPPRKTKKAPAGEELPLFEDEDAPEADEAGEADDGLVTIDDAFGYFAEVANQLSPTRPVTGAEGHLASEFSREWIIPDLVPQGMISPQAYKHYGSGGFVPLQKPALGQRLLTLIDRTSRIIGAQIEFGRGAKGWQGLITEEQESALEAVQGSLIPTYEPVTATDKDRETKIGSMSVAWINDNMDELIGANIVPSLRKRYMRAEGNLEQAGQDFDGAMRTAFGRPYWGGRGRQPLTTVPGRWGRRYDTAANLTRSVDLLSASALNAIEAVIGPSVSESVQGAPPLLNLPMGLLVSVTSFPASLSDAIAEVVTGTPVTARGRALIEAGEVPPYISDRSVSIYDSLFARGLNRVNGMFRFLNSVAARMQSYQSARTNPITGDMKKFLAKWTGKNAFNTELMALQIAQRAGVDLDQARAFVRGEIVDEGQAERIWRMSKSRSASVMAGEGIEVSESSKFAQMPFIQRLFTFWRWHDNYVRRNAKQLQLGASAASSGGIGRRLGGASRIGNTVLMASINAVIAKIAYLYWFGDDEDVEREWRRFEQSPYVYFADMLTTQLLAGPLGTLMRTAADDVVSSAAFLPGRIKKKGEAVVNMLQGIAEQAIGEKEGEARFLKGLEDFSGATKAFTGGEGGEEFRRQQRQQRRREQPGVGLPGMPRMPGIGGGR